MSEVDVDNQIIGAPPESGERGRGVDAGAKRNLLIMGAVLSVAVVIVVVVAYMGLHNKQESVTPAASSISLGNHQSETRGPNETISPHMQQELAARQSQDAEEAARNNRSYIPPDASRIEPVTAGSTQPQLNAGNSNAGLAAAAIVDRTPYEQDRRKNLEKFLMSFEEAAGPVDEVRRRFGAAAGETRAQAGNGSTSGTAAAQRVQGAAAAASAPQPASQRKLVEGFSVMASRLLLPLNIPENGSATVLAEVVAGPQAGALLNGTARVVNEGIEIRFTQGRFGKDIYPVQAIGLDGDTSAQILSGSVDRKIFQRYVIPIAAAMAQGYFTAKAAVGNTVVGVSVSGVSGTSTVAGIATPPATQQQAVSAGVAAGMQVLNTDVTKVAGTPIVVSVPSQTPIGVLFLNEVLEKGAGQ